MITLSGIHKSFGGRTLLEDASLQMSRGDRLALVGPNGAGKSTLFRMILGDETPDSGEVILEKKAFVGHLPQETAPVGEESVLELATSISPEFVELKRRMKAFEDEIPRLVELHDRVAARPNIKAYLESDRRIDFNEQGIFRRYKELDR